MRLFGPTCAIEFFYLLRVEMRDEGVERNKAVYFGDRHICTSHMEILGLWIEQTDAAKFWHRVMIEFKPRVSRHILIAVIDGLKRFSQAIESIFPAPKRRPALRI